MRGTCSSRSGIDTALHSFKPDSQMKGAGELAML